MKYYICLFIYLSYFLGALKAQDSTWLNIPKRNILIGAEIGSTAEFWKNPQTNEKTRNIGIRVVPRIGFIVLKNMLLGVQYEYEFTNKPDLPKVYGYGFFVKYYPTKWSQKINYNLRATKVRIYPAIETIFHRSNAFYDDQLIIGERAIKFNRISLGGSIDVKPFPLNFYANLGYRVIYFVGSPQKKVLPAPRLAINFIF